MSDPIILVDIDETCLGWYKCFTQFVNNNFAEKLVEEDSPTNFHLPTFFGVDKETVDHWANWFCNDWSFGCLPPVKSAEIYIPKLAQKGFKFVGITSCLSSSDPKETVVTRKLRRANIEHHFPKCFVSVFMLEYGKSKREHLQNFGPAIWVEDNWGNAKCGVEVGHKTYLINQPHNQKFHEPDSNITRVDDWREIYEYILNES